METLTGWLCNGIFFLTVTAKKIIKFDLNALCIYVIHFCPVRRFYKKHNDKLSESINLASNVAKTLKILTIFEVKFRLVSNIFN